MSTAADVAEGGARLTCVLAAGVSVAEVSADAGTASDMQNRATAGSTHLRKLPDTVL